MRINAIHEDFQADTQDAISDSKFDAELGF